MATTPDPDDFAELLEFKERPPWDLLTFLLVVSFLVGLVVFTILT